MQRNRGGPLPYTCVLRWTFNCDSLNYGHSWVNHNGKFALTCMKYGVSTFAQTPSSLQKVPKCPKSDFLTTLPPFGQNFPKHCLDWKFDKPFLELCLNIRFKPFLTQNYILACSKKFLTKKVMLKLVILSIFSTNRSEKMLFRLIWIP